MAEPTHLDTIHTADEAAARLRLTKRALIKIARTSGHCSRTGRDYLFSEPDLLAIWQDMREPAAPRTITTVSSFRSLTLEDFKWMADKPPTSVDARVLGILEWLDKQREPKTYRDIERAGPKTIDLLLEKGFVQRLGSDSDGLDKVKITPEGRDQIKIVERWKRKREAHRKSSGR